MKFLDLDWDRFFDILVGWEQLSEETRDAFLEIKPSGDHPLEILPLEERQALIDGGWLKSRTGSLRVAESLRGFNKAMRAMGRVAVLDGAVFEAVQNEHALLADYLKEHFTIAERQRLCTSWHEVSPHKTADEVGSTRWIADFLDYRSGADSDNGSSSRSPCNLDRCTQEKHLRYAQLDRAVLDTARLLVLELLDMKKPWSLQDAVATFEEEAGEASENRRRFGEALHFALNEALVLACLDDANLPFLGLWPAATRELERRRALEAAPLEAEAPEEVLSRPLLMEDMLALLVECAVDPPRLKANGFELFARNVKVLVARLTPLPAWLDLDDVGWSPAQRCSTALNTAAGLGLITRAGTPGADLRLVSTVAGERWASQSPAARLRQVIESLDPEGGAGWFDPDEPWQGVPLPDDSRSGSDVPDHATGLPKHRLPLLPPNARARGYAFWNVDPVPAVIETFLGAPADRFVRLASFVHQTALENNPYAEAARSRRSWVSEEEADGSWLHTLLAFFYERLLGLGAIALGHSDGDYVFRLTSVGRFLLGGADDFELESLEEKTELVVQPNLDIVLLAPSPSATLQLAAFASPTVAQKQGDLVGTLFQLTKSSVQRAAAAGYQAERLLGTLRDLSSQPLPANVETQVEAWLSAVRWAAARRIFVIDAGDPDTATRVLAAGGKEAKLLSETVVELPGETSVPSRLRRKLTEAGVFLRERESQ